MYVCRKPKLRLASLALFFAALCPLVSAAANLSSEVQVTYVPADPTNLSASFSYNQVSISWTDNSAGEDYFEVERKIGTTGTFVGIASTTANIATFTDNAVSAQTTYYYRVRACTQYCSGYSSSVGGTTPAAPTSGGGGGGGGGGFYFPPPTSYVTKAIFRGIAYPTSNVTILRDGQVIAITRAGPDAQFDVEVTNVNPGTYLFGVWAEDNQGNRSITQTFNISLANGATSLISGIFIPPFLELDKREVRRGDPITFFGVSAPNARVSLLVNSNEDILVHTTTTATGVWRYLFDTLELHYGEHQVRARAAAGADISTFSRTRTFLVGDRTVANDINPPVINGGCGRKGDFNNDCKVNLTDFSMMAYWFKRTLNATGQKFDLSQDGKVSLPDFSILAYYWTG